MSKDRELLVNLRNGQRAEVPLSEQAVTARARCLADEGWEQHQRKQGALTRLKAKALTDETLADLLIVLGL